MMTSDAISFFRIGRDGLTAEMLATFWASFEETRCKVRGICLLPPSGSKSSCKWNVIKAVGRYLGHHARTGNILIMTTEGVVKAKSSRHCRGHSRTTT